MLLMLLLAVTATAQSFPYNHPEILVGKEVKIIETMESEQRGYSSFYSTTSMSSMNTYMPTYTYSTYSKKEALIGKTFKVLSSERYEGYGNPYRLKLEAPDKTLLYYGYRTSIGDFDFPFEVIGGLTIPDEYYCDLAEKMQSGESTIYTVNAGIGLNLVKMVTPKTTTITLTVIEFIESDGKYGNGVALLLENNKKIAFPELTIIPMVNDAKHYKYMHTFEFSKKDLELLKTNKVIGVKFIDKVVPIDNGAQIQGALNCIQKL